MWVKSSRMAGSSVMAKTAAMIIENVLVYASGLNNLYGGGIQNHRTQARRDGSDCLGLTVTIEDRLGESGVEGALLSGRHDGLEERDRPVGQGRCHPLLTNAAR